MSTNVDMSTGRIEARVLIVDADREGARELARLLAGHGADARPCTTPAHLERLLRASEWDLILCDPETAPLESFREVLRREAPPALVLMEGFGSIHSAVEAVRAGASDYLSKPFSDEQVLLSLERALERRALRSENRRLRADLGQRYQLGQLESRDPKMLRVFEMVQAAADTRATILIEGESGTGKTALARSVHQHSSRAGGPFVVVNCGALPDSLLESELFGHARGAFTGAVKDRVGKFEQAHGGTLLLDEIGCASLDLQVKLLRVLQDRELERVGESTTRKVDVRVIAASNRELEVEVRAGRFRQDLYYRIDVLHVRVPPLRERPADIPLLAQRFLEELRDEYGRPEARFRPDSLPALVAHSWPGNVRELQNCVERALLLSRGEPLWIGDLAPRAAGAPDGAGFPPSGLPAAARPGAAAHLCLRDALERCEREIILSALTANGGSRKATARALEINRTTLFNKMKKYNLMDLPCPEEPGARAGLDERAPRDLTHAQGSRPPQ